MAMNCGVYVVDFHRRVYARLLEYYVFFTILQGKLLTQNECFLCGSETIIDFNGGYLLLVRGGG